MNANTFYKNIYTLLDDVTPLRGDCGALCGGACCKSSDSGDGMYLYPFEEEFLASRFGADKTRGRVSAWCEIHDSNFKAAGRLTPFLICDDMCERGLRPLACRIFPLIPYVSRQGDMKVILDPRAQGLCPLKDVSKEFAGRVCMVSAMLMKVRQTRKFIIAQSRLIDEFSQMF